MLLDQPPNGTADPVCSAGVGRLDLVSAPQPDPLRPWERIRILDMALLCLAAPIALIFTVPVALGNWVHFGDFRLILLRQARMGRRGQPFTMVKFRSLEVTESGGDGILDKPPPAAPFGAFLRKTHLDEIPQLVNILMGHMAFVGPRPELLELHHWAVDKIPGFEKRLTVRPGLTGRAQVTQGYAEPGIESYTEKLSHDLAWIHEHTLVEDIGILFRTVGASLFFRGGTASRTHPDEPDKAHCNSGSISSKGQ